MAKNRNEITFTNEDIQMINDVIDELNYNGPYNHIEAMRYDKEVPIRSKVYIRKSSYPINALSKQYRKKNIKNKNSTKKSLLLSNN